uniref:Aminopeptidase N n=1 Tax=Ditylenchus dipsaci TaxID=166011 RepID=A0A915EQC1_9BILA
METIQQQYKLLSAVSKQSEWSNCTTATVILKSSNNTLSSQKAAHPYRAPHKAEQPYYRRHWPAPFSKSSSSLVQPSICALFQRFATNATHKTSHLIQEPAKLELNQMESAEGHLRLLFHCSKPNMRVLKLHMRNITVHTETINIQTQTKNVILPQFESLNYTLLTNVLALRFGQAFEVDNNYTLYLDYTALVNAPEVGGLFRTGYKDKEGNRRVMLATQMQALEARRLLPCFDQPDFKAHFELEIKHPKGTNTVSNADMLESFDQGNWTSSRFKPTPKMSTYLLALAISEFSYKQTVYKGKKIRVWIQPAMLHHVDYALSATLASTLCNPRLLDVFGLPGLRVQAMVITSAKAADYIENSTSRQDELFFEETIKALQFDQRPHAVQPLSHPVNTFSAVDQKFSFATYWKASAILRMVEGTVGAQVFRTGLSNFLNKFTYGSARAEDLLIALNQAVARNDLHQRHRIWSNLTIKEFLDPGTHISSSLNEPLVNNTANNSLSKSIRSWIHQPGFPLIEFTRKDSSQQVVARQYPSPPYHHLLPPKQTQ